MSSSWIAIFLILVNVFLWVLFSLVPKFKKHRNILFIAFSFLSLLIFLCIRAPYSDMLNYENFFNKLDVNNFETINRKDWEILFRLLLYGIKLFTGNTLVLRCIIAVLTLTGPYLFIKRYSKNYLLTVVMFIAVGTFSMQFYVLRQAIAISIFLAAFHFITDKKAIKYCASIILAALFHQTALALLIIYPLVNIRESKAKKIIVASITGFSLILSPLITNFIVNNFYNEYAGGDSGRGIHLLLLYIGMYAIYIFAMFKLHTKDNAGRNGILLYSKSAVNAGSLFTIFWQFFATQNNMFCRFANYTCDSFCILIPNLIVEFNKKSSKIAFSVAIIVLCMIFILITGRFGWYSVLQ